MESLSSPSIFGGFFDFAVPVGPTLNAKENGMRQGLMGFAATVVLVATVPVRADDYGLDPVHSSVSFQIPHMDISWVHGRFNQFTGKFTVDKEDPARSSFELAIKVDSVDTNNKQRDTHLRSPTFFNSKQYPAITFKSTAIRAAKGGLEVIGDLTMHGVTKSVTFTLKGGKQAEFPKGVKRIGYRTDLTLKRSAYGMDKFSPAIGDEVRISIAFEGVKK
jgi:polyisoprenoid-binding protein YceI